MSRSDRIERAIESLADDFRDEHNRLLTAEILLTERMDFRILFEACPHATQSPIDGIISTTRRDRSTIAERSIMDAV